MNMIKVLLLAVSMIATAQAAMINVKKSSFEWEGSKPAGKHVGTIKAKSGHVDMKDDKISSGKVVIDMTSISTTDLKGEWKTKLDNHLKNGDFFDVRKKKNKTAMIEIKKVFLKTMVADLTIKGITKSVEFPYTKKGNTIEGMLTFDRTQFDIKYKSGNFFKNLGDRLIHNDIKLKFKLVLK